MATIANLIVNIAAKNNTAPGFGAVRNGVQGLVRDVETAGSRIVSITAGVAGFLGVTSGFAGLGFGVKLAAEAETARVAFATMLGSTELAQGKLKELTAFAASTPFELPELRDAAQSLLAYGTSADELLPTLRVLGDVAAGSSSRLSEIVRVFGQVRAAGVASLGDLNQLSDRGVPIFTTLQKQLGLTGEELRKFISGGNVTFADLTTALQSMSAAGGSYADAMAKQSETLAGRFSTLKDTVSSLALTVGEKLVPGLKRTVDLATLTIEWFKNLDTTTVANTVKMMALAAGFAVGAAAMGKIIAIGRGVIAMFTAMRNSVIVLHALAGPASWAKLAAGLLVAAAAVYAADQAFAGLTESTAKAANSANKVAAVTGGENSSVGKARMAAADLAKSTEELTAKLKEQLATYGMSANQVEIWKLAQKNAGDAALAEVRALNAQIEAKERAAKAADELKRKHDEIAQRGRALTEELRTPLEKYQAKLAELKELVDSGAIGWIIYGRAQRRAMEELRGAFKGRKGDEAFSLEVGSKEAFAARQAHLYGQQNGHKIDQLIAQQLAEQRNQTAVLRNIDNNTGSQNAGDTFRF